MNPKNNHFKTNIGRIKTQYEKVKEINAASQSDRDKITAINITRIYYLAFIVMPLSVTEILVFWLNSSPSSENESVWRMGIIITHSVLLVLMALLGGSAFYFRNHKTNLMMKAIQYTAITTTLLAGAVITCIDQLVTINISPFIIACSITGAIFLIRPIYAVMINSFTYMIFYYALSLVQLDPGLLLSNRVNGLFAIGVGFCLSCILWQTNIVNLKQKYFIACQQKELEDKNLQLEKLAFYDPLCGVFNRRYFENHLKQEMARISRYGNESCVAIIDIDDFKIINDRYGHPAGDYLLQKTVEIISSHIRKSDILARWGGDEFILLLPNTSLDAGKLVGEKIRNNVEANTFVIGNYEIRTTISFGISLITASSNNEFELSYINADKALYHAKQNGKNRIATY